MIAVFIARGHPPSETSRVWPTDLVSVDKTFLLEMTAENEGNPRDLHP